MHHQMPQIFETHQFHRTAKPKRNGFGSSSSNSVTVNSGGASCVTIYYATPRLPTLPLLDCMARDGLLNAGLLSTTGVNGNEGYQDCR
mmetsp:Transcript_6920/g.10701  ORF Transcript_6920/g.10701 Transcript_6920/m.10701 type:complete len:88 (+) Transcript_6920:1179-1442(+)